ncbi:hypothetical protein V8F20_012599 [Naviculisporaceae sp. PSN 640]
MALLMLGHHLMPSRAFSYSRSIPLSWTPPILHVHSCLYTLLFLAVVLHCWCRLFPLTASGLRCPSLSQHLQQTPVTNGPAYLLDMCMGAALGILRTGVLLSTKATRRKYPRHRIYLNIMAAGREAWATTLGGLALNTQGHDDDHGDDTLRNSLTSPAPRTTQCGLVLQLTPRQFDPDLPSFTALGL